MKKIAVLGPAGTNGHEVAMKFLGATEAQIHFYETNEEIMRMCEEKGWKGVVPIENCSAGLVAEVIRAWVERLSGGTSLRVTGQYLLPIQHSLMVFPHQKIQDIREVTSHTQALNQCSEILKKLGVKTSSRSSTAGAAEEIRHFQKLGVAAIASTFAAETHKLKILLRNIQDHKTNATRFHIIEQSDTKLSGNDRTAVIFKVENQAGALCRAMFPIGSLGVNMSSIHSIPLGSTESYAHYCEFDCHKDTVVGKKILACLKEMTEKLLVLGSYPR